MGQFAISGREDRIQLASLPAIVAAIDPARVVLKEHGGRRVLIGSIPGIIVGSQLAVRISDQTLRPILAGTLALVGARLVF